MFQAPQALELLGLDDALQRQLSCLSPEKDWRRRVHLRKVLRQGARRHALPKLAIVRPVSAQGALLHCSVLACSTLLAS